MRLRHDSSRRGKKSPTFKQLVRETMDWASETEGRVSVVEVCRLRLFFHVKTRDSAAV